MPPLVAHVCDRTWTHTHTHTHIYTHTRTHTHTHTHTQTHTHTHTPHTHRFTQTSDMHLLNRTEQERLKDGHNKTEKNDSFLTACLH